MELNVIYNEDCLEGMKRIPDNSIDLIVTDPPYNIKKAEWDSWKTVNAYVEWLGSIFLECQRVLKDNGSFYFFHNDFMQIVELQNYINNNTNFVFKQFITWSKIHESFNNYGFVRQRLSIDMMRNYYNGFTEYCLYYTFQDETGLETINEKYLKSKNPFSIYLKKEFKKAKFTNKEISKLFPSKTGGLTGCVSNWLNGDNIITKEQYLKIRNYSNNKFLLKEYEELRKEYEEQRYTFNTLNTSENIRNNTNVWNYEIAESNGHITPKPVELIENIIRHSSKKGNVILDPFMGSGTTAIACKNLERDYIGFELDKGYYKLATNRIRHHYPQTDIFDFIKEG